jgi:hypothetical protein
MHGELPEPRNDLIGHDVRKTLGRGLLRRDSRILGAYDVDACV